MTRKVSFSLPSMKGLRARLVDQRAIREQLVSVAGLVGRPVELAGGAEVGRVIDVVTRSAEATVPHVSGLVVKIGRRKAFVPIEHGRQCQHPGLSSRRDHLHRDGRRPRCGRCDPDRSRLVRGEMNEGGAEVHAVLRVHQIAKDLIARRIAMRSAWASLGR